MITGNVKGMVGKVKNGKVDKKVISRVNEQEGNSVYSTEHRESEMIFE